MRADARWFATRRSAAFTVATLVLVPSSWLASKSASSSRSITVRDIRSSINKIADPTSTMYRMKEDEATHAIVNRAESGSGSSGCWRRPCHLMQQTEHLGIEPLSDLQRGPL